MSALGATGFGFTTAARGARGKAYAEKSEQRFRQVRLRDASEKGTAAKSVESGRRAPAQWNVSHAAAQSWRRLGGRIGSPASVAAECGRGRSTPESGRHGRRPSHQQRARTRHFCCRASSRFLKLPASGHCNWLCHLAGAVDEQLRHGGERAVLQRDDPKNGPVRARQFDG
jgi:hypothetical protein